MACDSKISRRQFFARSAKAGISIAAVAAGAKLLCESDVLNTLPKSPTVIGLKDYSVAPIAGQTISIVSGSNRTRTLNKAIELLGGITRFVKPGETVLLKPNVGFARPPRICATSHPEVISEITRLCYQQAKAKKVYITDNPINDAKSCFDLSEISAAAEKNGAEIIMPRAYLFSPFTLHGGKLINNWPILYEPFQKADKVIGIAVVKNHSLSGASMVMKNWFGILGDKGSGKRSFFHTDINTIIVELASLIKPTLVILDGTEVMVANGPTGGSSSDLKQSNIMLAGCDQLAVDSFGATLLNLKPDDLPWLLKAQELNLGTIDYKSLKPAYAKLES